MQYVFDFIWVKLKFCKMHHSPAYVLHAIFHLQEAYRVIRDYIMSQSKFVKDLYFYLKNNKTGLNTVELINLWKRSCFFIITSCLLFAGVNMGYIENSYTNSNNGGSVNSQDSLWQMKMAAANNAAGMPAHQIMDRQSNYGYDPIAHGGYGTIDDYAPYPHLAHAGQPPASADYNMRSSQNPSRQEYCSDPYASVHKPKKRMDQHIGESLISFSITVSKSRH